jgi:hypothetical protein
MSGHPSHRANLDHLAEDHREEAKQRRERTNTKKFLFAIFAASLLRVNPRPSAIDSPGNPNCHDPASIAEKTISAARTNSTSNAFAQINSRNYP